MSVASRAAPVAIKPLVASRPQSAGLSEVRGGQLPAALADAYGSNLAIPLRGDRPTFISNFVSTVDGVVSYKVPGKAGGGEISGFFEPDRFVMGLLRSVSDAVLIGAGTLRAAPAHKWSPGHVHPASRADYQAQRETLGLAPEPTTIVVSASGDLDLSHPGLADSEIPAIIVTTAEGSRRLNDREHDAPQLEIVKAGAEHVSPDAIVDVLRDRGLRLVLCEGGPHLFGQLLAAGFIDELFLTLAPQVAGRSGHEPRLSLVEGHAFDLANAPWAELVDLRISGSHVFTRYRFGEEAE
jgi:riboflavin biosynthesis pyrimidine reductase